MVFRVTMPPQQCVIVANDQGGGDAASSRVAAYVAEHQFEVSAAGRELRRAVRAAVPRLFAGASGRGGPLWNGEAPVIFFAQAGQNTLRRAKEPWIWEMMRRASRWSQGYRMEIGQDGRVKG
ncbi:hypothetical protein WJ0W_001965 [Paenibacillus melissococcoides]|uniref:DAGKc domain-containing protein n=1 Tax=Paenibacillus melissococcoides TaxID=2912268 RepID=A0ABM9FZM0_9BACL|nr:MULTISPECIES: hypothetical protein [Paenibacillus]MEB9892836.1 hypothetical protein [Bacillus cereus]CAH8244735.1 hypothetical protein WJ0W_001965 [Paenibacillus melissococcoides]CAH8708820.1 hypothetical protein WDD9_002048 [Paenibacillus melissococcoides]CAH8709569.1 hypothetical protein HTL2_002334 [Paenibacillus melissococcoides]